MLNGNTPIHIELESELSSFLNKEDTTLCASGYAMMAATTCGLLRGSDIVFYDQHSHPSLIDGMSISGVRMIRFPHNDAPALQSLMDKYRSAGRGAMIVADGVCSIDGSIAPVENLSRLAKDYDARLFIDDAHGIGTLSGGVGCTYGHEVDIIGGVLSKALASCGGFVSGPRNVIDYLRFFGRFNCATTNVSVANAAAANSSLKILKREPNRVNDLNQKVSKLRRILVDFGVEVIDSSTSILCIICGRDIDAYKLWRAILDKGVLCHALPFPIVPKGKARIRFRVNANMSDEDLEKIGDAVAESFKKNVILPAA